METTPKRFHYKTTERHFQNTHRMEFLLSGLGVKTCELNCLNFASLVYHITVICLCPTVKTTELYYISGDHALAKKAVLSLLKIFH